MLRLDCRPAGRGRVRHLRCGERRIPHIPVIGRIILRCDWTAGAVILLLGFVRASWGRRVDGVGGTATSACRRLRW